VLAKLTSSFSYLKKSFYHLLFTDRCAIITRERVMEANSKANAESGAGTQQFPFGKISRDLVQVAKAIGTGR
jgi:hypothetical protein